MKIWSFPALLMGESRRVSRHYDNVSIWCVGDVIEEDLVRYVRAGFADVSAHLAHDANMFVAVQ